MACAARFTLFIAILLCNPSFSNEKNTALNWYIRTGHLKDISEVKISKQTTWGELFPTNPNMLRELEITFKGTMVGYSKDFLENIHARLVEQRESKNRDDVTFDVEFGTTTDLAGRALLGVFVRNEYEGPVTFTLPLTNGGINSASELKKSIHVELPGGFNDDDQRTKFVITTQLIQSKNEVLPPEIKQIVIK